MILSIFCKVNEIVPEVLSLKSTLLIVPTIFSGAKVPEVRRLLSRSKPNEIGVPIASEEVIATFTTLLVNSAFPAFKTASLIIFLLAVSKVSALG